MVLYKKEISMRDHDHGGHGMHTESPDELLTSHRIPTYTDAAYINQSPAGWRPIQVHISIGRNGLCCLSENFETPCARLNIHQSVGGLVGHDIWICTYVCIF